MRLAIGCPVAHRAWILPTWFEHVGIACERAGVEPTFVFVTDRRDPCFDIIRERASTAVVAQVPTVKGDDTRRWNFKRYEEMTKLRNHLLSAVRMADPDLFLSLDSDILLSGDAIKVLIEDLDGYDALGGRCYMTANGDRFPSWANLGRNGQLMRRDAEGCFRVDVIMGIKLMTRVAYLTDYRFDTQGEDVGWSRSATRAGLKLGWTGRAISKHVLAPWMLDRIDDRVGF